MRPYDADPSDMCAIYCVNLHEVAGVWSRMITKGLDDKVDGLSKVTVEHNRFLNEDDQLFHDG